DLVADRTEVLAQSLTEVLQEALEMIGHILVTVGSVTVVILVVSFPFELLAGLFGLLAILGAEFPEQAVVVHPDVEVRAGVAIGIDTHGRGIPIAVGCWSIRLLGPSRGQRQDQGGEAEHAESSGPAQRLGSPGLNDHSHPPLKKGN